MLTFDVQTDNRYSSRHLNMYLTKVKTLQLNCLPFIYTMMQASKANGNLSECSKTGLCITVKDLSVLA